MIVVNFGFVKTVDLAGTELQLSLFLLSEKVDVFDDFMILHRVVVSNFLMKLRELSNHKLVGLLVEGQWLFLIDVFDSGRTFVNELPRSHPTELK